MAATCLGEAVCGKGPSCQDCRPALDPAGARAIGSAGIPVRRYGSVPRMTDEEPAWEIETATPPRTIAEHGGAAVLLAAAVAAALGTWLLYCR